MASADVTATHERAVPEDGASRVQSPPVQLADPASWAITAFGTTSFMLGLYNAGIIDSASLPIFLPVAFFFGGLVQLIVAVLEVLRGNVFGAAVFGTYGPFWIIFGAIEAWFAKMAPASSQATGVAVFLFMFAVVTGYFFMASLKTDTVLATIFALIFAALVLLGLGYAMGQKTGTAVQLGGWVTLIFGVLAWYRAAAGMINANFGREILPVGHLS